MTQATKLGLARIVLLSPQRRVDLALPAFLPLVALQSLLLQQAGTGLADEGIAHHGWVLRRLDGSVLAADQSLAAQGVHDGTTLVLAPQDQQWPEPEYDDLADAVANEARQLGAAWDSRHTRRAGLALTAVVLVAGLGLALRAGPQWVVAGVALSVVAALLAGGAALAAAVGRDHAAAALLSTLMYPYASIGAALAVTGEARLGPGQLLVAGAALVPAAVLALVSTRRALALHVALLVAGLLTAAAALLAMVVNTPAAAAIVVAFVLLVSPWLPRIAKYQGGLPSAIVQLPANQTPVDDQLPSRETIAVLVRRSDQLLTGMLFGICAVLVGGVVVLAAGDDLTSGLLAGVVLLVCALRARSFTAVRHRLPLLFGAVASGLALAALRWESLDAEGRDAMLVPVVGLVVLTAGVVLALGRAHAARRPPPQLSRLGDFFELLLVVASPVLAATVAGVFGYARGLGG